MKSVLVTGATGYIGSHICKKLTQAGYDVIGVDLVRREHTIKYIPRFVQADYASAKCYAMLPGVMSVIHCAGTSLVGPSVNDPAEYYINNVAKTAEFLNQIRLVSNKPSVVFSSSAAVYGSPDVDTIYESEPKAPVSPYGRTKSMIEEMLHDYHQAYRLPVMSLRYFNACGADVESGELGQAPGATHIIARLLESARDNQEFTLYGNDYATVDGTCVRDYVHVDDLAEAHMLAIQWLDSFGGNQVLNLGSNTGYSNGEIIQVVSELIGPLNIKQGERRAGDPDRLVASNSVAQAVLGWSPKHSDLPTIVNSAWKWYNNPSQSVDNRSK